MQLTGKINDFFGRSIFWKQVIPFYTCTEYTLNEKSQPWLVKVGENIQTQFSKFWPFWFRSYTFNYSYPSLHWFWIILRLLVLKLGIGKECVLKQKTGLLLHLWKTLISKIDWKTLRLKIWKGTEGGFLPASVSICPTPLPPPTPF